MAIPKAQAAQIPQYGALEHKGGVTSSAPPVAPFLDRNASSVAICLIM